MPTTCERAEARDRLATGRDGAAESRDRRAENLCLGAEVSGAGKAAALARSLAAGDRRLAAQDRDQARRDRRSLQTALEQAQLDPLTGAYGRSMGTVVLLHELERANRSNQSLVLAYVDVDRLKAVNDSEGHAAGDSLLRDAFTAIRSKLRPYDPVVRWGGDEFLCAFPESAEAGGRDRFADTEVVFRDHQPSASMTVGLASSRKGESLESLTERADDELRRRKARLESASRR